MLHEGHFGSFYEDFSVGDVYRHPLGRTITEADNRWFTLLTMNTNQLHFNADYAAASLHGRELVVSTLTLAIAVGLSVGDLSQHAVANLAWGEVVMPHPLFVGDTLYAESIITSLRPSQSRPAGIVSCFTRGMNQTGETVISFDRTILVHRRSEHAVAVRFPSASEPIEVAASHRPPGRG